MRNAIYISVGERDMDSPLLGQIEKRLKELQYKTILRLEVDDDIDKCLLKIKKNNLELMEKRMKIFLQGPFRYEFLEKI